MGKYRVIIKETAEKDLVTHKKSGQKATIKKLLQILDELTEHPYTGTGKPEQLKHELTGYWSRRINKKDRIVYRVQETIVTVYVVSAMGHYEDR